MARIPIFLAFVTAFPVLVSAAAAQSSPLLSTNPILQSSLERIAKGSASWREALAVLRQSGRRAIVVTPDQVRVADTSRSGHMPFDASIVAEVAPVVGDDGAIDVVLVVVNLALLQEQHRRQHLLPIEFEMDLDRILVHEVYGHAVPYLTAGDASGRCADPQPSERAIDACSIQRENVVRHELGLGRRVEYGLHSLSLARRYR